jgi:hypothetical protein
MCGSTGKSMDLIELTNLFWWDVMKSNGNLHDFTNFLSPYCRIQDDFGNNARGIHGKYSCHEKLIELKSRIRSTGLDSSIKQIKLMKDHQIRFLIYGRIQMTSLESILASIGIAIEWQNSFITGIVISRNVDKDLFFDENYGFETNNQIRESCTSLFSVPLSEEYEPIPYNAPLFLGRTLNPPYLVPRPPLIPPTLSVHIVSCHNLQSRLIRFISRPIHCRISIRVGKIIQKTSIIKNSSNPIFCSSPLTTDPYVFQIPTLSFLSGSLELIVEDMFPIPSNILAKVHIPYSIIPFQQDLITSNDMYIRLSLNQPYLLSPTSSSTSSIPFPPPTPPAPLSPSPSVSKESDLTDSQELISQMCFLGDSPQIQKEIFTDLLPYLKIRISKVDVFQWWVMEELQARDQIRENQISELEKQADLSLSFSETPSNILSLPRPSSGPMNEMKTLPSVAIGSPFTPSPSEVDDSISSPESNWERYKYESMRWVTSNDLW